MSLPVCPYNNVIVQLLKKHQDEILFDSGIKLYQDTSFHPEEHVTLHGTVVSVPNKILQRPDYQGYQISVKKGDEILFRYDVVFSYAKQADRDTPVYKNLLYYDFQEYWLCDLQKIFAVKTGDHYSMQNGYVLLTPIIETKNDTYSDLIIRPESAKTVFRKDKAIIKYIGDPLTHQPRLSVQPGDTVYFDAQYVQEYRIGTEVFFILKQSHLLAKARAPLPTF